MDAPPHAGKARLIAARRALAQVLLPGGLVCAAYRRLQIKVIAEPSRRREHVHNSLEFVFFLLDLCSDARVRRPAPDAARKLRRPTRKLRPLHPISTPFA